MRSESSRLANMIARSRANESSRIANLIADRRECEVAQALARAANISEKDCSVCVKLDLSGGFVGNTNTRPVPDCGTALASRIHACELRGGTVNGPEYGVPDSVWVARLQQRTLDLSTDPSNPESRFSMYRRPFIQVCPPIPQWYYTAGEPVPQGKSCPLPNKPDNMILPG
jgi:hypothetical protein